LVVWTHDHTSVAEQKMCYVVQLIFLSKREMTLIKKSNASKKDVLYIVMNLGDLLSCLLNGDIICT
jgi:hypothetical protein